jgi:uncharacterized membrane protein YraQ (UPF0718 family)
MLVGPMLDLKIIVMLRSTFRPLAILRLALMVVVFGILIGWGMSYVG